MFAKYKISTSEILTSLLLKPVDQIVEFPDYKEWEEQQYAAFSGDILNPMIYGNDGVIKAEVLSNEQFPIQPKHVFISHSSKDATVAKCFAYYLSRLGIDCFIDSMIWNNISQLQRVLDEKYCWLNEEEKIFNYKKRNNSTAHVHAILSTALFEMIDQCECAIFLESDNSVVKLEDIKDDSTYSPWIYEEINYISKIRQNIPERLKHIYTRYFSARDDRINESVENLVVVYPMKAVKELTPLTAKNIECMGNFTKLLKEEGVTGISGEDVLEMLYVQTGYIFRYDDCNLINKYERFLKENCAES